MNAAPTGGAGRTGGPDKPHIKQDIYGGVWANCGRREDTSGEGAAPHAPEVEHKSFSHPGPQAPEPEPETPPRKGKRR